MVARLSRIIPMLLVLAVLAAVVYVVVAYKQSPLRAKEVVIKMFLVITGALSAFFGLFTLYSLFEANDGVFDLAFSFLVTALVGLAVTLFCRWRFLKNHPNYRIKPQKGAGARSPFDGFADPGKVGGDGYTPGPTANVPGGGIVELMRILMRMSGR